MLAERVERVVIPQPAPTRKTERAAVLTVVALGLVHTYLFRHVIHSDGISYLDIADAYRRLDWHNAINAYWSPLYSWILAAVSWCWQPAPRFEVDILHVVNFGAFCCAGLAFRWLAYELATFLQVDPCERSWIVATYCLFTWSALGMVSIEEPSPDLLGMACQFLVFALLLRAKNRGISCTTMALTGVILGIGYLARSAYFPLSLLCLAVMVPLFRNRRVLLAWAAFLLVAGPFVLAISTAKGRLTYGDAGTINYAWQVNGAARSYHWQGEGFETGKPVHPTRKIMDEPATFEFATPVSGTYPPWYDPSYWYEGVKAKFSLQRQWPVFCRYFKYLLVLLVLTPGLILAIPRIASSRGLRLALARCWWILLIPIAGSLMFCMVVVDKRHVAAFLAIMGLALFGLVHSDQRFRRRILTVAYLNTLLFVLVFTARGIGLSQAMPENQSWEIQQNVQKLGMREGDKIAYIGCSINAYWARLAKVRIIADVNYVYGVKADLIGSLDEQTTQLEKFWAADSFAQQQVLDLFSRAGATYAVADHVPAWARLDGWIAAGHGTYMRKLHPIS
jgi:hypothetical protein